MEKANYRRIVQLGKTTHCVSLPKAWLEKHGIEKGDTVLLDNKPNGHLIIVPNSKDQTYKNEITLDAEDKGSEELKRNIIAAYINGYTKINITGEKVIKKFPSNRKDLQKAFSDNFKIYCIHQQLALSTKIVADYMNDETEKIKNIELEAARIFYREAAKILQNEKYKILFDNIKKLNKTIQDKTKQDKIKPKPIKLN